MKHLVRLLALALLLNAADARAFIEVRGRPVEERRRAEERRGQSEPTLKEKLNDVNKLPREARDGKLWGHEGKDRGYTLRMYVAEARTHEKMREHLFLQEREVKDQRELANKAQSALPRRELNEGYASVYHDRPTAERVTDKTIEKYQREIDRWLKSGSREDLVLRMDHGETIGQVLLPAAEGTKARDRDVRAVTESTTRLVREEGGKGYYISGSHPSAEMGGERRDALVREAGYKKGWDYSQRFESEKINFEPGHTTFEGKLEQRLIVIQLYDSNRTLGAEQNGRSLAYWAPYEQVKKFESIKQWRDSLALPPEFGDRNRVQIAVIEKGTYVVYEHGIAKPVEGRDGRMYPGQGEQVLFRNVDEAWIKSRTVDMNGKIIEADGKIILP